MELYLFFKDEWENSDESFLASISVPKKKPKNKEKKKPAEAISMHCQELNKFLHEQELPLAKYSENGTGDNCKITCRFHRYRAEATGTTNEAKTPFFVTNEVYSNTNNNMYCY